ncbi:hypothetical protein BGX26_000396 [Mortierella sp. AD094]|nr:hypothetical protein BGX26_000396 [Mortierella sp. AD094]
MLATILYGMASLVLCVMISNATGPAIDYSHLSKPTATVSSVPPVPAAVFSTLSSFSLSKDEFDSLLATAHSKLSNYNIERIIGSSSINERAVSPLSSYSFRSWRLSAKHRRNTATKATTTSSSVYGYDDKEERPQRSRYSPPAAYSADDYEQYELQHATSFNKSESGFCGTEGIYSHQEQSQQDWKTQMPINIPSKP